jgi:galactose mutarotase-like enzyme
MQLRLLENDYIRMAVSDSGAELRSLVDLKSGREWMWQGNPEFWPRTSPVLFPVVGKLRENELLLDGKKYSLSQHGFARDRNFRFSISSDQQLTYILESDDESRKIYPFEFRLTISYKLLKNQLEITYKVENTGNTALPFSIGAHPGFSLPGWPQKKYALQFEQDEELACIPIADGLLDFSQRNLLKLHGGLLDLSADLFQKDALVIPKPASNWISIVETGNPTSLRVHFEEFSWLGLWSKPGAPFVCIEPWEGHADPLGFKDDFFKKPGICILQKGEVLNRSFCIELLA